MASKVTPLPTNNFTFPEFKKSWKPKLSFTAYQTAAKAAAFFIAGGISLFLWPAIAPPLLVIAGTVVATRLVIKIIDLYTPPLGEKALLCFAHFHGKHLFLLVVGVVIVLATAILCWQAACVLAIPLGIYLTVVSELNYYTAAQEVQKKQEQSSVLIG